MSAMPNTSIATFRPLTGVLRTLGRPAASRRSLPCRRGREGASLQPGDDQQRHGKRRTAAPGWFEFDDAFWKLDDLEALALHPSGFLYAMTSHSRDGEGREKPSREKLVRFRLDGDEVVDQQVARGLKAALLAAHPVLAPTAAVLDVKNQGGLNIEAMEFTPDAGQLWLGLRSPVLDGQAILATVENPNAMFDAGEPPRIAPTLLTLDLDGYGVRGMAWVASLAGYLLIAGPVAREPVPFRLWFWSAQPSSRPHRVEVPGLAGFAHAEGVCPAILDGREVILIVSDDGNRAAGRCARYLLLEADQLRIAP